jgi:hypothetical protein
MGIETALLATAVIGTGIQSYGAYREGQDAKEAAKYNASVAREEAGMIEQSGALDAERQRKQVSRLIGTQKAAYGAAGVELTGSVLDTMINTAAEGELDAAIIDYNAKTRARGAMSQAAYDEKLAEIYGRSGTTKAAGTLLTSAASLGAQYYTPKTTTGY